MPLLSTVSKHDILESFNYYAPENNWKFEFHHFKSIDRERTIYDKRKILKKRGKSRDTVNYLAEKKKKSIFNQLQLLSMQFDCNFQDPQWKYILPKPLCTTSYSSRLYYKIYSA